MSERKVLNKYYPPDFDPSKIPRMKLPKNRQYTVRLMAPFNMRCKTCGEYIYRGKKFNARKEDVEGDDYCGIRIYRFYIKCTRCLQEISFKTDPRNTDYEIEAGATRNFMALKLAQEQEKREEEELKEEEANNPMKLLENRTQQSKIEIELMECLEEIKDLNRRHYNIDFNQLLKKYNTNEVQEKLLEMQREKDEQFAKELMSKKRRRVVSEEIIDSDDEENESKKPIIEEENIDDDLSEDEIIFTNTITPSSSGKKSTECKSTTPSAATSIEPLNKPVDTKPISINRELPTCNKPSPIDRFKKSLEGMKNTKKKCTAEPSSSQPSSLSLLSSYDSNSDGSNSD